jgi:cell wall-associated NlpC family hydrolase
MQVNYGTRVSASNLQAGDLVFFYSPISHVATYLGKGLMVTAPQTGDVVRVKPVMYNNLVAAVRL